MLLVNLHYYYYYLPNLLYTYIYTNKRKTNIGYSHFFCYLNVDLVTTENNRNVFTDTNKITMPVGNVLVSNSGSDIKHDDGTLTLDAVYSQKKIRDISIYY